MTEIVWNKKKKLNTVYNLHTTEVKLELRLNKH